MVISMSFSLSFSYFSRYFFVQYLLLFLHVGLLLFYSHLHGDYCVVLKCMHCFALWFTRFYMDLHGDLHGGSFLCASCVEINEVS